MTPVTRIATTFFVFVSVTLHVARTVVLASETKLFLSKAACCRVNTLFNCISLGTEIRAPCVGDVDGFRISRLKNMLNSDCWRHVFCYCDIDTRLAFRIKPGKLFVSDSLRAALASISCPVNSLVLLHNPDSACYSVAVDQPGELKVVIWFGRCGLIRMWRSSDWVTFASCL